MQHDGLFEALAQALLSSADTLVPRWLPEGRRQGHEWVAPSLSHSSRRSLSVNLVTGVWADFAGDDRGGNLIALYATVHRMSYGDAGRELAAQMGMAPGGSAAERGAPAQPSSAAPQPAGAGAAAPVKVPEWAPLVPVPDDAPDFKTQWGHYARGVPAHHWVYRDQAGRLLGVVCRFEASDGSKDVQPLSYCQGPRGRREWRYKALDVPRPLYGLWRLPRPQPDATEPPLVVVVEGEKCADALWDVLEQRIPVLSWSGGAKAVRKADWAPLAGSRVVCWPDADAKRAADGGGLLPPEAQPGLQAMRQVQAELARLGNTAVRIVDVGTPGEHPDGWDCADAVAEGWTRGDCLAFMARLLPDPPQAGRQGAPASTGAGRSNEPPHGPPHGHPGGRGPAGAGPVDGDEWRARLIWRNQWSLRECVPNVIEVMANHPDWSGVVAFDEFAQRVCKRQPAPWDVPNLAQHSDEWTDVDDTRAAAWIALHERFVPSSAMVAEAVNVVARMHCFHPVREWLQGLHWDGTPRLEHWMVDHMAVADNEYVRKVSRYFVLGMVMRVISPGCKFDYCLVLEGKQGRRKSSALRVLGGQWFSDIELDLANKDSMSNIRGKWLHEFGEMGSVARVESTRQKSFLSRQVDEFRPSYGRREIRCPRQLAFAGTTNEWQWNKDPTGGRRFWPVEVGADIDTNGLAQIREQLFAEAYALAMNGERYWPTGEEQRELFDPEQLAREAPEAFVELLSAWFAATTAPTGDTFTMADAICTGLRIEARSITRDIQTRVGIALAKLGCERVERRDQVPRFVYRRVRRNHASSQPSGSSANSSVEVPF